MRIGQLASATGVSARTIRHDDSLGLLTPTRGDNQYRAFQMEDVERVKLIQLFLGAGFRLDEIRERVPCFKACCTPTDRVQKYDPVANRWTALAPMPERGVTHAGMTTDGTDIYYAGGYTADEGWTAQIFGTRAVWKYNVVKNSYIPLPDLPVASAAGQLADLAGKLHYFGGTNPERNQDLNTHWVLDLAAGDTQWRSAAPLQVGRNHLGSAVLNNLIYAIGGQTGHDDRLTTLSSAEAYDPATNRWTTLPPMPQALSHTTNSTFVLSGRIVVAGGERAHDVPTDQVTAYDPQARTWTALSSLPELRVSGVAAALGDGFIFTGDN